MNSGRLLKRVTIVALVLPAVWMVAQFADGALGPNVLTALIRRTGLWTVRLLLLALAVTPVRHVYGLRLVPLLRRPIGIACACYATAHLTLYVVQQHGNLVFVASEIARRIYLLVGFLALVGLVILALTSTDAAVRRLGRLWKELHRLIFPISLLALLHFFMQAKLDVSSPTTYAGLLLFLLTWRALPRRWGARLPALAVLVGLAVLLTAEVEAAWYQAATRVPPIRVLRAELVWRAEPRPASVVLAAGLAVLLAATIAAAVRSIRGRRLPQPRTLARM